MNIHLLSLMGYPITTLPQWLEHYAALGISSLFLYVHEIPGHPDLLPQVRSLAAPYPGARILPVSGDWLNNQIATSQIMQDYPDDWFVIADQDELQLYPRGLSEILAEAEQQGFDSLRGFFVDRIAADGKLKPLDPHESLWTQYPLGAFLTYAVCRANFKKVVAAKGRVRFRYPGHHGAEDTRWYPITDLLIEVHHFKWIAGLIEYLQSRTSPESPFAATVQREADRFIHYYRSHGDRICIEDPGLLAAPCTPHYPHTDTIRKLWLLFDSMNRTDARVAAATAK